MMVRMKESATDIGHFAPCNFILNRQPVREIRSFCLKTSSRRPGNVAAEIEKTYKGAAFGSSHLHEVRYETVLFVSQESFGFGFRCNQDWSGRRIRLFRYSSAQSAQGRGPLHRS